MRISLATDTFLPEVNGVTTVLAHMRNGLRARGHQVQVLAPAYGPLLNDESGIHRLRAVPAPGYPQVRLSFPWGKGLGNLLRQFQPDVIHAITEGPLGVYGRGFAVRRRIPLVSSFHTDFPRYAAHYLGKFAVGPTQAYLRWFHNAAGMTQTPSDLSRDELLEMGVPRAAVWGRGVDTAWFRPERRSTARRALMGVEGDRALVLHVGRLAVEKSVETLVSALVDARTRLGDKAVFCVAGDGPKAEWVRASLPFAQHLGFLDRQVLADLYADADIFVFPSATETCGLVALEALASGVPVVAANAGGVRENLRQGITGMLVAPGNAIEFAGAIEQLVLDGEQRRAMHEAARAFAVGRDWSRELDQLESIYQNLCSSNRAVVAPSIWPTTTSVR